MQRAPDLTREASSSNRTRNDCELAAKTSTSTYTYPSNRSLTLSEAMMPVSRWFLLVVAAVAVALSSSSPFFTATAAARPLPYPGRSSPTSTSLDCATVTSLLAGCKAFVRSGVAAASPSVPARGAACCEGVAELYAVASDSADNWRSVCRCMAGLVRRYPSNASAIALLPALCAVLPPARRAAGGDTLTYCTSPS